MSTVFEDEQFWVFFGQSDTDKQALIDRFSSYRFHFIHQSHSALCVPAENSLTLQADAHWTDKPGQALAVQTADCLPILVADPSTSRVWAIHAGWRGLASGIIPHSLQGHLQPDSRLRAWIGPHIRQFEVGLDVANQLEPLAPGCGRPHSDAQKRWVDLAAIARSQLEAATEARFDLWVSPDDTFTNPRYHSFRRAQTPGRQWSAIALKAS